ncbi:phospholipase DDHD1b isoform X5 [Callorhinchus milii]|uniref:phospholipase DDHD1b isoform X5 n=1 Tax=Callorhinchus milii TaxID=7868 RepID=UPI001C3FC047|nr:phospholipase DDHD1b isoform X5 [Callorhinchus milii]
MFRSLTGDSFDLFTPDSEVSLTYPEAEAEADAFFSESDLSVDRKLNRPHSTRHHRYEVVGELGSEEVRWFYKEDKKTWKPFIGYDSLRVELMYREHLKEMAAAAAAAEEAAERPGRPGPGPGQDGLSPGVASVCVRGGLYEVNVVDQQCYPVYWHQVDTIPVMRGQWFIDGTWQPLEEEDSNLIEAIHSLKLSRNHVDWYSVDEVYLYSDATTSKIARTVTQKLGFSKASSSGTRLHRGYVEESSLEDKPPLPTHIVFVIHGIGQKMDQGRIIKNTGMMRDAARKIEEKHFALSTQLEYVEFLPVEWRSKLSLDGDIVESITPDKIRGLRDILNSSAMDIMYYTSPLYRDEIVKGLQWELNRLYTLFCSRNPDFEVNGGKVSIAAHSLGCVITYDIMTGWHPVRFYDQMIHDEEETTESPMSFEERQLLDEILKTKRRLKKLEQQLAQVKASSPLKPPALQFNVENFFCMGSPLAVFLALRGIRPQSSNTQDHILPKSICKRLFNIFHPTDPVAYRLEPLILKHYSNIAPLQIHWYNTGVLAAYDEVKPVYIKPAKESVTVSATTSITEVENVASPSTSPVLSRRHYGDSITSLGKASIMGAAHIGKGIGGILFARFTRSGASTAQINSESIMKEGTDGEEKKTTDNQSSPFMHNLSRNNSYLLDGALELEHRIDFELREGLVESRYWSAVTSHTAYWSSLDVALFLLSFLYTKEVPGNEENNILSEN